MPIPTTTCSTRAPAVAISVKMPQSFRRAPSRPTSCRSFGHLSRGATPSGATASATAAPATSVSGGISFAGRVGRSKIEK
jgi:hypothetical protein